MSLCAVAHFMKDSNCKKRKIRPISHYGELGPDKRRNRTSEVLLQMDGNATYQDLDSRIGQTLASAAFRPRLNAEISATPIELWRAPQPSYFAPYAASPSFGVDIIPPPCHYVS